VGPARRPRPGGLDRGEVEARGRLTSDELAARTNGLDRAARSGLFAVPHLFSGLLGVIQRSIDL